MSNVTVAMPSFKVAAAALRKTTEHLAQELDQPSDSPPDWNEFEWTIARAAAAMQGISMLLANTLSWSGPLGWQSFLQKQREQSLLRDVRIGNLLREINDVTGRAKISCVGLKGAALRELSIYAPGERPMGDVDLLVRAGDVESVDNALGSLDYVQAYTSRRHIVYAPQDKSEVWGFGEHIQNPLTIEVHTTVSESLPVSKVDITNSLQPQPSRPGLHAYPDRASLMLHLLLHAAGNMRVHALRQIQLHDIARLGRTFNESDWRILLGTPHTHEPSWWLYPPLALAERYYPDSIPPDVLEKTRGACPRALRFASGRQLLTDLSWANLAIPAFPGITWSRTPLEALRLVRSRVLPNRTALKELKHARQIQPHLDGVPWYGIPHASRILRWLFSRPPRVQTILSVRAALEGAGTL